MHFSSAIGEQQRNECHQIITNMIAESDAIETAILSSPDGILLTGVGSDNDLDVMAAMSASLLSLADALSSRSEEGRSDKVITESPDCSLVVLHAGKLILTVIGKPDANIGMVLTSSRKVAAKIASNTASIEIAQ